MRNIISKIFTLLTILTLGITNVWAADPDLAIGTDAQTSSSFLGEYSTQGITLSSSASYSSGAVQIGNTASAYNANYFEVLSSSAEIEKVSFLISGNGSNKSIQAPVFAWEETANGDIADTYVLLDPVVVTANSYAAAQWFEYDLSSANVKCARIYRTTKKISSTSPAYTGSSTALGSGQTIKIYGIKVWLKSTCAAGAPGDISKGALVGGTLTLNAAGSAASGDTWYWQTAADGTSTSNSGSSFGVDAAGTYYIRSYNTAGDCWSDAKSITITSTDLVENYTVVYKDGTTELGSEVVAVGSHPAGIADPTKDCYTFAGWMNGSTPVADVTALSGTADEEIELTATWTPVYSSTLDFAAITVAGTTGANPIGTFLASGNMVSKNLSSSAWETSTAKSGYIGYKLKDNNAEIKFLVQAGKQVVITFGSIAAAVTLSKNGVNSTISAASGDNAETVVPAFVPAEDMLVSFKTSSTGTVTIKKIAINSLYTATYIDDENGNSSENNVAQVTLGTPTGSKTFMGWKADQAVTVDDEVVAANTTIAGGKTAVLSANTTFTAQWSDAAFTVTYYDGATELGSENVVSGGNPVNYADYQTKAMATFDGWYSDSELNTPIADISALTITANTPVYGKWTSTDARLSAIEFSSNAGTLSPAFNPEVVNYTYTMPYKTADIPTITGATSVNANAKEPVIVQQASAWNETAIIRGVAQSDDTKAYNITMKIAPKDGVSIIKVETTGGTNKTVTGLYAGDGDVNLSSSKKMDGGKYIGFTLDGTALQAGDRINVHTTTAANTGGSHIIFYDNMTDKNELYETGEIGGAGDNIFTINAAMVGQVSAYVYRSNADAAHQWNGYVDFIEVTRAINPILTAITINGEAGVIDEEHKTVAVELQPGYDLAALTIVPTIVSNTDEALVVKTVTSNEGNWELGPNTYRLTDKDGDYTEYTITLTAGALKHNVTFNTHGGSAVAGVEVVDGEYLTAGQVPANPTKEDYIFQYWSETEDGSEVDITTVQINADKEFHAVWASDGAIKLLDGSTVNHTNFITGVTASTVEIESVDYNCVATAGNTSAVNNSNTKNHDRVIAYNATTTQTKIQLSLYNSNGNARSIEVKGVVEGTTDIVDLGTINLTGNEKKVTEYIEFNNAKNRTIYIYTTSNAGHIKILQVKVLETGTALPMAGDAGYSFNLNQGRLFGKQLDAFNFEGLDIEYLAADYTPLSTSVGRFAFGTSISFDVTSDVTMSLTAANNKTYYVTKDAAGTDNETSKTGVSEFALTAGTWYITAGAEDMQFTNIAFSAPKCEQPDVTDMVDVDLCEGDAFTALAVTATVSDGGTLHYQWYKHPAVGDDEAVGIDAATYTPDTDGQYYVVVTNQLSGFGDNSKTSNTITVEHFAAAVITTAPENQRDNVGETVTLSVTASGKNLSYEWFTCDDELGTNPVAIVPAETNASLSVTVAAGTQWYKVVVSSDCGNAEAVAKVSEFTAAIPQDVTATTTWDWTTDAWPASGTIEFANQTDEQLLADVDAAVPNNAAFHSDMLYGIGQYVWRSGNKFFQGKQIRFNNTVAGRVRVHFRSTGSGKNVQVTINGTVAGSGDAWQWTNYVYVPAGGVTIVCAGMTGNETGLTRIDKIEFQTPDYTRTAMLGNGVLGTLCVDHNVPVEGIQGATFYELAGKNAEGKIAFDEIISGELEAGVPYVFQAHGDNLALYYGTETEAAPVNGNGIYGTFTDITLPDDVPAMENLNDIYYFAQKALWSCTDLTSLSIPANRAYVKLSEIPSAMAPAPGRIRMTLNVNGAPQVVTGVENLENNEAPVKMLINGQLFIMRGEKLYDATGRLVK